MGKTHQFKHNVKDNKIIREKLQIPNLLVLEIIPHGAQRFYTDAE